jgi:hypothetical protein
MDSKPKPSEETYQDYRAIVEAYAESAIEEKLEDDRVNTPNVSEAVSKSVEGSKRYLNRGRALSTILLSEQNPDHPDYYPSWDARIDQTDDDLTSLDYIMAMAYVCFYSDVMDKVKRMREDNDE